MIVSIHSFLGKSNRCVVASNQRDFREVCAHINLLFTGRKRVYTDLVGTHGF